MDNERLIAAQGYLSDYLSEEDLCQEEAQGWFGELGEFVSALAIDDSLLERVALYLSPFLDDDDRIDGLMYPQGAAVTFLEVSWGGDFGIYLEGFIDALAIDHERWMEMCAKNGSNAEWRYLDTSD